MSATITFTATLNGETFERTSGTMPYVAVSVGSQVQWHKSFAAAHKAAVSRTQTYSTGVPAEVIPALPTKINGKLGDWTPEVDGWGDIPASAFTELVAAKRGGGIVKSNLDRRVEAAPVPTQDEIDATVAEELGQPVFKSYKGGEYRAQVGSKTYRVRKVRDGAFLAQRQDANGYPWVTLADVDSREAAEQAVRDLLVRRAPKVEAPATYPGEAEFDRMRHDREVADRKARMGAVDAAPAKAKAPAKVAAPATVEGMVLVKVDGKSQARLDTVSGTLVWRNSAKGRAARAAGLWV